MYGRTGRRTSQMIDFTAKFTIKWLRSITASQVIIAIFALALSGWCMYNVVQILDKYYSYDTIVSLYNEPPEKFDFPSITICAPTIMKPDMLARLDAQFAAEYSRFKSGNISRDELQNNWDKRYQALRDAESRIMATYNAYDIITNYSVQPEDLLQQCQYKPVNVYSYPTTKGCTFRARQCTSIRSILPSIYQGRKCFTYFSVINDKVAVDNNGGPSSSSSSSSSSQKDADHGGKSDKSDLTDPRLINGIEVIKLPNRTHTHDGCFFQNTDLTCCELIDPLVNSVHRKMLQDAENEMYFDLSPSLELYVRTIEYDTRWWYYTDQKATLVIVHPPEMLQNQRDFVFLQLSRNDFHELTFSKKITYLMEPPYKTRCAYYDKNRKLRIYKTQDECVNVCIKQVAYAQMNCANYYNVLTETMFNSNKSRMEKICPHHKQSYSNYLNARKQCETEQQCPVECVKSIYEVSGRVLENKINYCDTQYTTMKTISQHTSDTKKKIIYGNFSKAAPVTSKKTFGNKKYPNSMLGLIKMLNYNQSPMIIKKKSLLFQSSSISMPMSSIIMNTDDDHDLDDDDDKNTNHQRYYTDIGSDDGSSTTDKQQQKNKLNIGCAAQVSIRIAPKPSTIVRHQEAITYEGFLGTIGGHIGIWLGLSLYKIIKFVIQFMYEVLHQFVIKCSHNVIVCCFKDD